MRTFSREIGMKIWQQYWDEMTHSWVKLEVLPDYSGEDRGPSYDLWLQGKKDASIAELRRPDNAWRTMCQAKVTQGVKLRRVRILEDPLTDYSKWELECYRWTNMPAGEQIYVIDRTKTTGLALPAGDVMVFDGTRAVEWAYDKTGRVTHGFFYEHAEDQTRITELVKIQATLFNQAQPLTLQV